MAHEERTLAQLLIDFADNTQRLITPEDMRSLLLSLTPDEAGMYISTPAETTIANANEPTKIAGETTASVILSDVTMPQDNRLQHTGDVTRFFKIVVNLSLTAAGNNLIVAGHIAKNGSPLVQSEQHHKITTGTDIVGLGLSAVIDLAQDDYIEIWIENKTSTDNITIEFMNVAVVGFISRV